MSRNTSSAHLLIGTLAVGLALMPDIGNVRADEDWRNLYLDTKPVFDIRHRYEVVDRDGNVKVANANTVRTRFGLETGRYYGFGAGVDFEWIAGIGAERYNDTLNGNTLYPVVADPEDLQLNQLYLISENTIPGSTFKLGRQRIIWDNARFIGNVGFRQNEQTFDAIRASVTAIPKTTLEYTYLNRVHRIFGTDSPSGEFGIQGHGFRAQFKGIEGLTITPFALLLDYDQAAQAGLDSQTFGVLLDGNLTLGDDWKLLYGGSAAYQADYSDNPADFNHWYYRLEGGVAISGVKLRTGYEVLQGDGATAFQTPLATLHKFNGFTDQFLTTPSNGIEDLYISLDAAFPFEGWLSGLKFKAGYHEFWADRGGAHYGSEWDAGLFKTFQLDDVALNVGLQYASYLADNFSRDTNKFWLTINLKLKSKPFRSYFEPRATSGG